jgi:putative aldouronate transport system permease protein
MVEKNSISRKAFIVLNTIFLIVFAFSCIFPVIHILAVSFSNPSDVAAGKVLLWPVGFSNAAYKYIFGKAHFWNAFGVSVQRVLLGVIVNMILTVITAYPLSKTDRILPGRTLIVWFFVFTILFSGGMIPAYLVVSGTGLIDSIWALILPGALPVFNMILMLNFFRSLPKEMEESAMIDGAGYWTIMWRIAVPCCLPALATFVVFCSVGHWNSWFDGLIYMRSAEKIPLQTYLKSILNISNLSVVSRVNVARMRELSERTVKSAQVFIATVPILMIYPFLQRYFMSGIIMGSVKE